MNRLGFSPSPLTLGTVQLGLRYGIANRHGLPGEAEAERVLDLAWQRHVSVFDTARAYGDSETRIGRWRTKHKDAQVHIVTKVPTVPPGSSNARRSFVREQIAVSLAALQATKLDVAMTHRGEDLLDPAIVEEFQDALAAGTIGAFGASLYDPQIGLKLLESVPLAAIQVPANVVDRRFERAGVFKRAQNANVTVFVRSAFLQGALLMESTQLPQHLSSLKKPLAALRQFSTETGRQLSEILLVAARDIPGANSVVVGVELATQLQPHLAAIASPPLNASERAWLDQCINDVPDTAVDPSRWPR